MINSLLVSLHANKKTLTMNINRKHGLFIKVDQVVYPYKKKKTFYGIRLLRFKLISIYTNCNDSKLLRNFELSRTA